MPDEERRRGRGRGAAEADARLLGRSLFPVRLFLGLTFVYGGIQKLTDPGFLHPGAPTYIGTQLQGFAHGTPGGFLLRTFAIPHPGLAGVGVALTEIAVGLLVASGLLTRPAAVVGLALNLLLFLTNSWNTYPYFLGSDIVFVFAWVPFVLAGSVRQPTLEARVARLASTRRGRGRALQAEDAGRDALTRRGAIETALGLMAAATAAIAGVSVLVRGPYRRPRSLSAQVPARARRTSPPPAGARTTATASSAQGSGGARALPPGAVALGAASRLPVGQGATYTDPGDGRLDIVIRQGDGTLVAHSAVCTHAGCSVEYAGGQLVCPCHGSVFDARTGAVITGPAVTPLAPRRAIQHNGKIYAVPA